ncbi:MAG: hypothetical protein M3112_01625 [Actinomycetia bacterium]|nr:hypothetical protein [Actinomycetes bacterium]
MTEIEWHQDREGFESGVYRIRRIPVSPRDRWHLEIGGHAARWRSGRIPVASSYATLSGAKDAASRAEREQGLQDRMIGHSIVGVAAFVVFATLLPLMGSLITFAIAMVAFYVGLRSFTAAIIIRLGDVWGWTRDRGATVPFGLSDRAVLAGIEWLRRRSIAAVDDLPDDSIRVLPPEPPE